MFVSSVLLFLRSVMRLTKGFGFGVFSLVGGDGSGGSTNAMLPPSAPAVVDAAAAAPATVVDWKSCEPPSAVRL